MAEYLGIYGNEGVADPRVDHDFPDLTHRCTANRVRFDLAPLIIHSLYSIWGRNDLASRGDYRVEGDMLVTTVSLDVAELRRSARLLTLGT